MKPTEEPEKKTPICLKKNDENVPPYEVANIHIGHNLKQLYLFGSLVKNEGVKKLSLSGFTGLKAVPPVCLSPGIEPYKVQRRPS